MRIIVTIKSFGDEMSEYDFLIPSIKETMNKLIYKLVNLEEPAINIIGLNTVHLVDDYREELYEFQRLVGQKSYATRNKIADGQAKVIYVKENQAGKEYVGFHIFISKIIVANVVVFQWLENQSDQIEDKELLHKLSMEKLIYFRLIRHELCHVEDENNKKNFYWLDSMNTEYNLQNILWNNALRLWGEFYACKRSNFIYDMDSFVREVDSMLSSLEIAEKEICELRWQYNNKKISIDVFITQLYDYVLSAFIYGCYFMGNMDRLYEYIVEELKPELYPSRFYVYFPHMWSVLRKMDETYPEWKGPEVFDALGEIILKSIEEFEVYPKQTIDGVYYDIPVVRIHTRSEEAERG